MAPVITIMGPIGSGKSVQAELLAKTLKWETFSTGKLIREGSNQEARAAHDAGKLADTRFVQELVLGKIKSFPETSGIILDGNPRMLPEAIRYDEDLPKLGRTMNLVILLMVPEEVLLQRLSNRGRSDDTPEGIKSRFHVYDTEITPTIERYREHGIVREVDGLGTKEAVNARIVEVLHREHLA